MCTQSDTLLSRLAGYFLKNASCTDWHIHPRRDDMHRWPRGGWLLNSNDLSGTYSTVILHHPVNHTREHFRRLPASGARKRKDSPQDIKLREFKLYLNFETALRPVLSWYQMQPRVGSRLCFFIYPKLAAKRIASEVEIHFKPIVLRLFRQFTNEVRQLLMSIYRGTDNNLCIISHPVESKCLHKHDWQHSGRDFF